MSLEVTQLHKLQYASSVAMVAQQTRNPVLGMVTHAPATGEAQSVADLINSVEYKRGEEKSRVNPENPVSASRRWVVLGPSIESGQYISKEDKFRTATDPTSTFVRAHTLAVNRGCADITFGVSKNVDGAYSITEGGILGIAREGKTPGVGTALPSSQYLAHGSTGMTLDKTIAAVEALNLADFGLEDSMDELFCAITPKQKTDLIKLAASSKEALNAFQIEQIKQGKPTTLMGITWVFTNRLPFKAGTSNVRLCPVWSKANIIYAEWQGIIGNMWNDSHAKNLPYCHVDTYADVVRAEDKGVIVIECQEA